MPGCLVMMLPPRLLFRGVLFFSLFLQLSFFAGIIPDVGAAIISSMPVISVMQEKVRISPEHRSSDITFEVPADTLLNPVAKGILTSEKLSDISGDKVVRVGCLLPLSGPYADYGQRFLQGMEMALEVYPGKEPHPEKKIKLLVRDTQGMADAVIPLVHELIDVEQVNLLIGPVVGQVSRWAAKEASALHIPIITLTSQPDIAAMGGLVFQHFITARNQAEELVRFMAGNLDGRQPVILYPDTLFGRVFSDSFAALAFRAGLTVVKKVEYQATATDFGLVIKNIIGDQVETNEKKYTVQAEENRGFLKNRMVLVLPGSRRRLKVLLPQLAHYGLENILIFGSRGWNDLLCDDDTSLRGLDRVFFVDAFSASAEGMPTPLVQYRKRYEQQFEKKASLYDAYGYDTVMLIKQVVGRLSGWPVGGEQLAAAIQTLPEMEMVTGITNLRPDGEIEKRLYRFMAEKDSVAIYP